MAHHVAAKSTRRAFLYVVARDFGFAPNPFHGTCTLATCKPRIRSAAKEGDWVVGFGGGDLKATGRCIFAMEVTDKITFTEYWNSDSYAIKRPVRNGSPTMLVGDNIYHRAGDGAWVQADSHHSQPDGSPDVSNLRVDTSADAVLLSTNFYYFGRLAPQVPAQILADLSYANHRNHRTFPLQAAFPLLEQIRREGRRNYIMADPINFDMADGRYSAGTNRVTLPGS